MNAIVSVCARNRRAVIGVTFLLLVFALPGLTRIEADNSAAIFTPRSGPGTERLAAFSERFGRPSSVRILVEVEEPETLWSAAGVAELGRLEREARAIPCVALAGSAASRAAALLDREPPLAPNALREELARDPLARGLGWIARDGSAASVLVELAPIEGEHVSSRRAECDAALDRLTSSVGAGLRTTLVGNRPLERELDRSGREVPLLFFPFLVAFAVALLAATFRDLAGVFVPLAFVGVCEAVVLGGFGWASSVTGTRFHLVLGLLPPLLFVLALATVVHVAIRCRSLEADGMGAIEATIETYREKGAAVLWTSLSTACGFASLQVSDVTPVAELGLWATLGLGVQLVASFTLLPALLAATGRRRGRLPERELESRLERWGGALAARSAERRGLVLAAYAALAALAALGLGRLRPASDPVAYFAPEHPLRRNLEAAQALGIGTAALELELVEKAEGAFFAPETLAQVAKLGDELRAVPGIESVATLADLADAVGSESPWAELSTPEELRAQALAVLDADQEGREVRARFATADGRALRVPLFVPLAGYETLEPVAGRAEELARAAFPAADVAVTGVLHQVLAFHRSLVGTLGVSIALTLPALAAVFFVLLRRPGEVAKALVPNVWPVVILLGGMGWLGLGLDLATVMVASIVLGIAVDDTIHTLAHHSEESSLVGARAAVCSRIERTAPAYLLTGAILCAGFGVCALSSFEPLARFGQLAAAAIALAVISDLLLVPALFGGEERRGE